MNLKVLKGSYTIYRFEIHSKLPGWILKSDFYSVTSSSDELSVVALHNDPVPAGVMYEPGWRILKITGPLDFSLVGIIAGISGILSEKNIPIFIISSFNTDFILVKSGDLEKAVKALEEEGHIISNT